MRRTQINGTAKIVYSSDVTEVPAVLLESVTNLTKLLFAAESKDCIAVSVSDEGLVNTECNSLGE